MRALVLRGPLPLAFVVALAFVLGGCFFDSSWWQQRAAQQHLAQQRAPRALQATPSSAASGAPLTSTARRARLLRIRAYATDAYAAEVVDWPRQFSRALADANQVVEPTLDARLELVDARRWDIPPSDSLEPALEKLAAMDAGGADWVVGLVGSLPIFVASFHQLGLAETPGNHLVMRAMNDAREREAIEIELHSLADEEKEELYQKRKRHKTTTVLLHELGHTLGLVHETDAASIMSTRYDKGMTAFSPASAEIMRLSVDHRLEAEKTSERSYLEHWIAAYDRTQSGWVARERDAMLSGLRARLASPGAPPETRSSRPVLADDSGQPVNDADRAHYEKATAEERAGRTKDAWDAAQPLFARYPTVYAIQDLRCRLALKLTSIWQDARRECEPLMNLSRGKKPPRAP